MLSTAGIVVLIALVLCTLIQIVFIVFVYGKLANYKCESSVLDYCEPVSVVIAARNELENLKNNLDTIINQDYEKFEIVIVNDGSTDGSKEWLDKKENEELKLKVIHRDESIGSKKQAVTEGIKNAKYSVLLFTDADCKTYSSNWISRMVQYLHEKKSIGFNQPAVGDKDRPLLQFPVPFLPIQWP